MSFCTSCISVIAFWKFYDPVSPCFKPSNANGSQHVRGIACCIRLEYGNFFQLIIVLFGNSFQMAFWRCNVQIPRLVITNYGINHGSHNGIDGGEQIFTNRQTSKVPTTFYQDEDQDNDCCAMDLLRAPFFIVHAWQYAKSGVPSLQEFLPYSPVWRQQNIFSHQTDLYLGLPSCVIFFSYFRIFQKVRNHYRNFHFPNGTMSTVKVEEIKITHTLFMIVACVQICWVIDIADTVHGMWTFPREVYVAYSFLATLNSALNPIILVLRNRNFRREYFKVLRCSYLSQKKNCSTHFYY